MSRVKDEQLQEQLKTEQERDRPNVNFVEAMRLLDRDPALQSKKTAVYAAILAETNLTGLVEPDANSMLTFFQVTANDEQRRELTDAVKKHLPP